MRFGFHCILVLLAMCGTRLAPAAQVQVDIGWGGIPRAGRWNAAVVRVSDPLARNALLELNSPHGGGFGVQVRERFAIGPTPTTYELCVPMPYGPGRQSVAIVRDAGSGRTIGQFPTVVGPARAPSNDLGPGDAFMGISGRAGTLDAVADALGFRASFMPARLLPRAAIGYDALEVLFLRKADRDELDDEQQRAIVAWIRAGGSLLFAPSDNPMAAGPLLDVLPCRIGPLLPVNLDAKRIESWGLAPVSARMTGRALEPSRDASRIAILGDSGVAAYEGQLGLGRITVMPVDLAALQFTGTHANAKIAEAWAPLLAPLALAHGSHDRRRFAASYEGYQSESEDQQRQGVAINAAGDFLANAPAPRWRWFARIVLLLICIGIVLGPVDWIVQRALGRPAWTVSTTIGALLLVASAAGWIIEKTGAAPVTYRSVSVIDQVGDETIGESDLIALYSPVSRTCSLSPPAGTSGGAGWWQAALPATIDNGRQHPSPDLVLHANDRACVPEPIALNAGDWRFLRRQTFVTGPAMLQASLSLGAGDHPLLAGSITNVSSHAMGDIHVRTRFGVVDVAVPGDTLAPRQSVTIHQPAGGSPFSTDDLAARYQSYGAFGSRNYRPPMDIRELWSAMPDLAARRSLRIDALIGNGAELASIYARVVDPASPAVLGPSANRSEAHFRWLRAVFPGHRL